MDDISLADTAAARESRKATAAAAASDFLDAGGLTVVPPSSSSPPRRKKKKNNNNKNASGQQPDGLEPCTGVHVVLGLQSVEASDEELEASLAQGLAALGPIESMLLYNKGSYMSRPFAMVTLKQAVAADDDAAMALLARGATEVLGQPCTLKRRKKRAALRKQDTDSREAKVRRLMPLILHAHSMHCGHA